MIKFFWRTNKNIRKDYFREVSKFELANLLSEGNTSEHGSLINEVLNSAEKLARFYSGGIKIKIGKFKITVLGAKLTMGVSLFFVTLLGVFLCFISVFSDWR